MSTTFTRSLLVTIISLMVSYYGWDLGLQTEVSCFGDVNDKSLLNKILKCEDLN